jgi:ketosteroid isomerase-like protein
MSIRAFAAALAALVLGVGAAGAQNLSLRGPAWAQPLLASDIIPTNGGRAALNEPGIAVAARITIAPNPGGVARVVRFEDRGATSIVALRRFTGHPTTGWWMWGPDTPTVSTPSAAQRAELAGLVRASMGVGATLSSDAGEGCPSGEQAFVELAQGGRSLSVSRLCVTAADPVGRLALRLSEIAGSRNEEELQTAAVEELMGVDRAFNAKAQADGVGAAFAQYASSDAILMGAQPIVGQEAVAAAYANWPAGARLQWAPETARVSSRGDMGWTWGRSTYTPANGAPRAGRYVSIWKRDFDGNWRFSFDAPINAAP